MLSLFRTNQVYASLLLYGYAVLLQLPLFFLPAAEPAGEGMATYYGDLLLGAVGDNRWLQLLLPPLLVATAGMLINAICIRYRFARTDTQFPGMALVLVWGLCPAFHRLDPLLLTHLLLVLAIGALSATYKGKSVEVARFNAGWWLGCASLLGPTYLLLLPCFVVGISIFRTAHLRSILQLLGGVAITYFLAATYAYLQDDLARWYELQAAGFGLPDLQPAALFSLLGGGLLVVLLLIVLVTGERGRLLLNIEGNKNVSFVYWLLLFAPLVVVTMAEVALADAQVLVVPLGVLFGLWLVRQDSARAEFYHLLLFVAALTLLVVN